MKHPLYYIYHNMKQRCYNSNRPDYKYYGERNITVCDDWLNSFDNFVNDMFPVYFDKASLDRIDVNGNYCKENCRWVIWEEQARNKRVYQNANAEISGVSAHGDRWRARFYWKKKSYSLGVYDTKDECVTVIMEFRKLFKE